MPEGTRYVARVAEFEQSAHPCRGSGATRVEALEDLQTVMSEYFASAPSADGGSFPCPSRNELSGRLSLRLDPELHESLIRRSDRQGVSINALISNALSGYVDIVTVIERPDPAMIRDTIGSSDATIEAAILCVFDLVHPAPNASLLARVLLTGHGSSASGGRRPGRGTSAKAQVAATIGHPLLAEALWNASLRFDRRILSPWSTLAASSSSKDGGRRPSTT